MSVVVKKIETEEETRGKAYVQWRAWHEAYPGLIDKAYLDRLTLAQCEKIAFGWTDAMLIAKDGGRVVGYIGYGRPEGAPAGTGEIFAVYVLEEYYGKGVALALMEAALEDIKDCAEVVLWTLKENKRAIRFYEKCGFVPDGAEKKNININADEIRMVFMQ